MLGVDTEFRDVVDARNKLVLAQIDHQWQIHRAMAEDREAAVLARLRRYQMATGFLAAVVVVFIVLSIVWGV